MLHFNVTVPTPLEIIEVLSLEIINAAKIHQGTSSESWAGTIYNMKQSVQPPVRFALLAAYVTELAIVHACEALYRPGVCQLSQAVAALALALVTLEAPAEVWVPLRKAFALLNDVEQQQISVVTKTFREVYVQVAVDSVVRVKWQSRTSKADFEFPPALAHFPIELLMVEDVHEPAQIMPNVSSETPRKLPKDSVAEHSEKKRPRDADVHSTANCHISASSESPLKRCKTKQNSDVSHEITPSKCPEEDGLVHEGTLSKCPEEDALVHEANAESSPIPQQNISSLAQPTDDLIKCSPGSSSISLNTAELPESHQPNDQKNVQPADASADELRSCFKSPADNEILVASPASNHGNMYPASETTCHKQQTLFHGFLPESLVSIPHKVAPKARDPRSFHKGFSLRSRCIGMPVVPASRWGQQREQSANAPQQVKASKKIKASPMPVRQMALKRNVLASQQLAAEAASSGHTESSSSKFTKESVTEMQCRLDSLPKGHPEKPEFNTKFNEWLQKGGWKVEYGPSGSSKQIYFLPPGVKRATPFKNRQDYFDSQRLVLQHLKFSLGMDGCQ